MYPANVHAESSENITPSPSSDTPLHRSTTRVRPTSARPIAIQSRLRTCSLKTKCAITATISGPRYWISSETPICEPVDGEEVEELDEGDAEDAESRDQQIARAGRSGASPAA